MSKNTKGYSCLSDVTGGRFLSHHTVLQDFCVRKEKLKVTQKAQKSQKGLRADVAQNNFCDFRDFCVKFSHKSLVDWLKISIFAIIIIQC